MAVELEHGDLGLLAALADDHLSVHRLAAGEELRLRQDRRTAAPSIAAIPAALALGFQPRGPGDALDLVAVAVLGLGLGLGLGLTALASAAGLTLVHHRVGWVVVAGVARLRVSGGIGATVAALAAPPATASTTGGGLRVLLRLLVLG